MNTNLKHCIKFIYSLTSILFLILFIYLKVDIISLYLLGIMVNYTDLLFHYVTPSLEYKKTVKDREEKINQFGATNYTLILMILTFLSWFIVIFNFLLIISGTYKNFDKDED